VDARAGHPRQHVQKLVLVAIRRRDPGTGRVALLRNETKAHDERRRGSPDDPVSPTAMLLVMRSRQSVADRQIEAAVRPEIEQASWYSNGTCQAR
jgi:hypothetical protein